MTYEIPLFPLNTVLFPGMPLQLHVFEERYKIMMEKCLQADHTFGVVLIAEGQEALGPLAKPHRIGCVARITQVEKLEQGRLNLNSFGIERFKIDTILQESPYLTAAVEPFPLQTIDPGAAKQAARQLAPFLEQYLALLANIGNLEVDATQVPDNPVELAYVACYLVQTSADQKQELLEQETTDGLLQDLRAVYRREIALLRVMTEDPGNTQDDSVSFSQN